VRYRLVRVAAVVGRNVDYLRASPAGWLGALTACFEPMLYLGGFGYGLGELMGGAKSGFAGTAEYMRFLAPALVAASILSVTTVETTFNFYSKLRAIQVYDAVIMTPCTPLEIAAGELAWASLLAVASAVPGVALMAALGLFSWSGAVGALVVSLFAAVCLSAIGLGVTVFARGWQDFEIIGVVQYAMLLFSGTFAPLENCGRVAATIAQLSPFTHVVALTRAATGGHFGWVELARVGGLAAMAMASLAIARRQIARTLLA
jgi:lipooligosaccharide transport system permease protein